MGVLVKIKKEKGPAVGPFPVIKKKRAENVVQIVLQSVPIVKGVYHKILCTLDSKHTSADVSRNAPLKLCKLTNQGFIIKAVIVGDNGKKHESEWSIDAYGWKALSEVSVEVVVSDGNNIEVHVEAK